MEALQEKDLTEERIKYLIWLDDRWNKTNSIDELASLRSRGYVCLYACIHNQDKYDVNRIYQSIQFSKWLKEIYLCILNEYLTASKMELEVAKKSNIDLAVAKLQEAINLLKGGN